MESNEIIIEDNNSYLLLYSAGFSKHVNSEAGISSQIGFNLI